MTGQNPLADDVPQGRSGSAAHRAGPEQRAAVPIRLVRGNASPDELSALIAVFIVVSSAADNDDDAGSGESEASVGGGTPSRSGWGSPERLVRRPHPHGPGEWRRSAAARTESSIRAG